MAPANLMLPPRKDLRRILLPPSRDFGSARTARTAGEASAIALQGAWSVVLVLTGSYRALFTRVIYTEWIFFALVAASLFFLRKRPDYKPLYKVWGFPVLPGIFVVSSLAIVAHEIIKAPKSSLTGLALVAAGLPVYWIWTRRTTKRST